MTALRSVEAARASASIDAGDLEVIVIDDGHEESAKAVCDEIYMESLIRYLRSERGPKAGPSMCRNQGIRYAKGELIYLLDDDDTYLPSRFIKSLELFNAGAADIVLESSLRTYVDDSGRSPFITGPYGSPDNAFHFLLTGGPRSHITPGATSFRKEVWERAGGYDETLWYGEDGELLLRLCLHGRVALVEGDPVTRISIHKENISGPARQHYWGPVLSLAKLHRKIRGGPFCEESKLVARMLSAKFDFALTRYRQSAPSYGVRIREGLKVLRHFDWRCTTVRNLKSVGVWLTKAPYRGS